LAVIGSTRLRELDAATVDEALRHVAKSYSSAVVTLGHGALTRVIRHAMARSLVAVNVSALCDTPPGQAGRPSRSLTLQQVAALLAASAGHWMHAYIALCVGTGIRTEEIRALDWSSVDLDGNPGADSPVPRSVQVWRSVRAHGDVKTEKSRRTLALPQLAVDALRAHSDREKRSDALVFATRTGRELDAANVRREFGKVQGCRRWPRLDTTGIAPHRHITAIARRLAGGRDRPDRRALQHPYTRSRLPAGATASDHRRRRDCRQAIGSGSRHAEQPSSI
jgi:integrase